MISEQDAQIYTPSPTKTTFKSVSLAGTSISLNILDMYDKKIFNFDLRKITLPKC